jgi:error-prone DNA polymerase
VSTDLPLPPLQHPPRHAARRPPLPVYAELHCRSSYSFLSAASMPEELVARAQALGYGALALTDECSLAGIVRAHAEAERLKMRLIVGAEMQLSRPLPAGSPKPAARPDSRPAKPATGPTTEPRSIRSTATPPPDRIAVDAAQAAAQAVVAVAARQVAADRARAAVSAAPPPEPPPLAEASERLRLAEPRLVLLVQSRRGYTNLVQWITLARRRADKGSYLAQRADVEGRSATAPTLAGLPGCFALLVPAPGQGFETLFDHAMWLRTWFGAERAAIAVQQLQQAHDAAWLERLERVAAATGLPLVASGGVCMHVRSRKALLDVLGATRLGSTVADAGLALAPNAESHLRSRLRLAQLFRASWLQASMAIAGSCAFSLAELKYEYPREITPEGHTPTSWLRHLAEAGAAARFPAGLPPKVRGMIEHELALIQRLRYEPYFLTVADIVTWARSQGILCQGRGSAANSAVCYCLGVTAVNPDQTTLLFERFLSEERNEPPDIDIDFEHQRREEVIQYIYRKYGRHRAALTGVVISYRPRSALRDVGRALGIDLARIEALSKSQHWFDGRHVAPERLRENGFDPDAPLVRHWMRLTHELIGFPRHLSQHPGGFVIARDDLAQLVPVENATMAGRSVIQWDKDDLDTLGLLKVDILALGMLSAIRRALQMVGTKLGRPALAMHELPQECPQVYAMLSRADSVGVFQVESRAQMSMLPRLQPRTFYDLVVEVAIVRPGPIQGGMVHPYLRRRNGEEPEDYPSDEVKQALQRTMGVPIFQEQVMQLAILAADFTPGEADQLRRAMAAWKRKGGLGPFHQRLVGRMVEKGYAPEYAERIFKQIQGFGEYGFPESHAASFALLVYVSAWLKCHHPDAFLAALLNAQPLGFYAPAQLVRDAREHGVTVLPVCVLASDRQTMLEAAAPATEAAGPAGRTLHRVRLGLDRIAGFSDEAADRVLAARAQAPFSDAEDLARRALLDEHELRLLAEADALVRLSGHRHQAAWAAAGVDTRATALLERTRTAEPAARLSAPGAAATVLADYRSLGLSLTQHPLALLRPQLAAFKVLPADVLKHFPDGRLARASGLVTHRQRPETAKGVVFVTLEDETGSVNVIVWPREVEAQRKALLAAGLLTVYGVWQRQGEVRHLVARKLIDHSALLQGLASKSRDFR